MSSPGSSPSSGKVAIPNDIVRGTASPANASPSATLSRSASRRALVPSEPGDDQGELLAADAPGHVDATRDMPEDLAGTPERRVGRLVAEAIVKALEAVEVAEDQARGLSPLRALSS